MALYDWNNDGKNDIDDDIYEYELWQHSTSDNSSGYSGPSSCSFGCLPIVILTLLATLVVLLFEGCMNLCCAESGCDNDRRENSPYCWLHSHLDKQYSSPSYYDEEDFDDYEDEESNQEKTYTPKTHYYNNDSDDEDPYNASDYSDPEDFYDDNYDDFWDYEDAEDYYNEHYE